MKKIFALLTILLAIVFQGFAQDTITGVVNRVAAPYFEQNVCDSRFALTTGSETYYVMIDNYWPNPYLEDLVIHYDTIPVGNEIEVVGTILEMEDGNGDAFQTVDISKNLSSNHQQILGFYYHCDIAYPGPDTITAAYFYNCSGFNGYCLTINETLQAANPFVINGRTLVQGKRYLFIGIADSLTNFNGNDLSVFELADALPYDVADLSFDGTLTMDNVLCLTSPCGGSHYLSLFDGEEYHYLTHNRTPQNSFINDEVFMEGDSVAVGGYEFVRYDLFGSPFKAMEIVKLQSKEERTLVGLIDGWGMPYIGSGIPIPGVFLALISGSDGNYEGYYIMKPNGEFCSDNYFVVNNDTVYATMQQLSVSFTPDMYMDNWLDPYYRISVNQIDFCEYSETLQCTLIIEDNPLYFGNTLAVSAQDKEIYFLKPFIYCYAAPNYTIINNKYVSVGDEFTALGTVSSWYDSSFGLHKVIDISEISNITELIETTAPKIQALTNPSNGNIEIVSEQIIKSISVCDCVGRVLLNKACCSKQCSIDLKDFRGFAIISVVFQDGHKTTVREIVR